MYRSMAHAITASSIYGAVSIGYAQTENGLPVRNPLARTGNPVTWIG